MSSPDLAGDLVRLEPCTRENVDLLVEWTLDPVAQGPFKKVPDETPKSLSETFRRSRERRYFLIRRIEDGKPLGRFYYRPHWFSEEEGGMDWELDVLIADPEDRGRGYGTEAQRLVRDFLLAKPETRSVFAYTAEENLAERGALEAAGFRLLGPLPQPPYEIPEQELPTVLYVAERE